MDSSQNVKAALASRLYADPRSRTTRLSAASPLLPAPSRGRAVPGAGASRVASGLSACLVPKQRTLQGSRSTPVLPPAVNGSTGRSIPVSTTASSLALRATKVRACCARGRSLSDVCACAVQLPWGVGHGSLAVHISDVLYSRQGLQCDLLFVSCRSEEAAEGQEVAATDHACA